MRLYSTAESASLVDHIGAIVISFVDEHSIDEVKNMVRNNDFLTIFKNFIFSADVSEKKPSSKIHQMEPNKRIIISGLNYKFKNPRPRSDFPKPLHEILTLYSYYIPQQCCIYLQSFTHYEHTTSSEPKNYEDTIPPDDSFVLLFYLG
eukprot:TRINITY_DN8525_c0_g1_i2.p1 TRINITY_DN8525_c0_g1~~TRINITY_DN8525_c0_g1_i2.p1  ORF type:complete len:148 (+),score=18.41 TRINITY_DN8525_c0_g1_i2:64-507(+)